MTKTPTRELKRIHGKCKGSNKAVEEELRRRGFNSKMLEEVQWEWSQQQWERTAKRASKISTTRNAKARRKKKRTKWVRWHDRKHAKRN